MSLVFNMVGGGSKLSKNFSPEAAEIKESWLPIKLNSNSTTGEGWSVDVGDKQIRADTFMGAMISLQDDYIVLPIIMSSDGTYFGADFAVPLINSAGQCALAEVMISVSGDHVEEIYVDVQETFDLSDPTSKLVYERTLYIRPNPT